MPNKDLIIIDKLIVYCKDISDFILDMDKDKFMLDSKTTAACAFSLGQIGELSKKLSSEFKDKYDNIPWHKIYGLRNRLFHDYDGVNKMQMWFVVSEDIPILKNDLEKLKQDNLIC